MSQFPYASARANPYDLDAGPSGDGVFEDIPQRGQAIPKFPINSAGADSDDFVAGLFRGVFIDSTRQGQ